VKATNEDFSLAKPMKLRELENPLLVGHAYKGPKGLHILCNREHGEWHISVSCEDRYPTWDELRDVCWALKPLCRFNLPIPKPEDPYTNLHNFCLHVYEEAR
jgi:hypothetical protein